MTPVRFHLGHLFEMQNKCDLAQEMYEAIIETPNVPNNIRANAYKQLGKCTVIVTNLLQDFNFLSQVSPIH